MKLNEEEVIDLIMRGAGYRFIAQKFGVGLATLHTWMGQNPERLQACAKAREHASHTEDETALNEIASAKDAFELAKARELAIHRRWRAKALNPKQYADSIKVDAKVEHVLTPEQIDERLAQMAKKFGIPIKVD